MTSPLLKLLWFGFQGGLTRWVPLYLRSFAASAIKGQHLLEVGGGGIQRAAIAVRNQHSFLRDPEGSISRQESALQLGCRRLHCHSMASTPLKVTSHCLAHKLHRLLNRPENHMCLKPRPVGFVCEVPFLCSQLIWPPQNFSSLVPSRNNASGSQFMTKMLTV